MSAPRHQKTSHLVSERYDATRGNHDALPPPPPPNKAQQIYG